MTNPLMRYTKGSLRSNKMKLLLILFLVFGALFAKIYKNQSEIILATKEKYPDLTSNYNDEEFYKMWADEQKKLGNIVPDYIQPGIYLLDNKSIL